jgi:hypothetical protein
VLGDSDLSTRELAVSLIGEMLNNQVCCRQFMHLKISLINCLFFLSLVMIILLAERCYGRIYWDCFWKTPACDQRYGGKGIPAFGFPHCNVSTYSLVFFVLTTFLCGYADFWRGKPLHKCSVGKIWSFQMSCCMYQSFLLYIIVNFVSNWCKCATNFISWSSVLMQVVVPLLVSDDEKTLVVSINCLTKVSHITF